MSRILIVGTPQQSLEAAVAAAVMEQQMRGGTVVVETFMQDGEPQARIVSGEDLYSGPEDSKAYVAFVSPEDDPDVVFREISRPSIYTGDEKIFTGEIGTFDCGFRFVPTELPALDMPRIPKQKAQWKRERKGRR